MRTRKSASQTLEGFILGQVPLASLCLVPLLGHLFNVFFIVLLLSKKIIDSLKSVNCITEMGSKICYYIMTLRT